jgi:hypothetical protein
MLLTFINSFNLQQDNSQIPSSHQMNITVSLHSLPSIIDFSKWLMLVDLNRSLEKMDPFYGVLAAIQPR